MARTTKSVWRNGIKPKDNLETEKEKPEVRRTTDVIRKRRIELGLPSRREQIENIQENGIDHRAHEALYDPLRFPHIAYTLCKEYGFTNTQLAQVFDVAEGTVAQWTIKHKEFKAQLKKGKDEYDGEHVENALLKKCLGYTFEEKSVRKTKILGSLTTKDGKEIKINVPAMEVIKTTKHMSPDTKAIMFWLQNRNSSRWKNVTYMKAEVDANITRTEISADITNMKSEDIRALRDIIMSQQQKAIPIECQGIGDDDLDDMIAKARDIKQITDAILVEKGE